MDRNRLGMVGIALAGCLAATGTASASFRDDIVPPPWERYKPFTTFQEWDFNDPGNIPPDGSLDTYNPNTTAFPNFPLLAKPGPDVAWFPDLAGTNLTGIYFGGAGDGSYIDFCVPNWIDEEPLKVIWIQINGIWGEGSEPFVSFVDAFKGADEFAGQRGDTAEIFAGFHRAEQWIVRPNPDVEIIRLVLPEGAVVNQVVIDTISFPAPGAGAAFALAGVALVRRRR